MSVNCNSSPDNNFCTCGDNPDYIQYNADGLESGKGAGNRCCNVISSTPDILQKLSGTNKQYSSTSAFLYLFNQLEFTPCDYTKYFGGHEQGTSNADVFLRQNYNELYVFAERQRIIYNNFYVYSSGKYPSSVRNNTDLVPVISDNTITTPTGTIPLILNYYDGIRNESQYLFVVWPDGRELPELGFPFKFFYFYDNNDNDCKSNYCTTTYSPSRGISFSNSGPGNNDGLLSTLPHTNLDTTIVLIVIILLLMIIFIAMFIKEKTTKK